MKKVIFTLNLTTGVGEANIDVYEGEGLSIVGLCGSGKSKLLRNIAKKAKGITYRGISGGLQKSEQDLFDLEIGYVSVDGALRKQCVKDVLERASVFYDMLISEVSAVMDIPEKYYIRTVGELPSFLQARLALLDTMSVGHSVILIDDVFGLDGKVKESISEFLVKAGKKPLTYIIATSDLRFASICAKSLIIDCGRVVEWGRTARVLKSPVHPFAKWFVDMSVKGKTGISWRRCAGKLKRRACRYALICPEASADCLKEYSPFAPYTRTEYTSCHLAELKKDKE